MKVSKAEKFKQKNQKAARLIVRNLSFKCDEKSVEEHFSKCGEIVDLKLLRKGDKLVGCGFIQYKNKLSAAKAIAKLSGNEFLGRPIIVDWALPKDKFHQINASNTTDSSQESSNFKTEVGESKIVLPKKEVCEDLNGSDNSSTDEEDSNTSEEEGNESVGFKESIHKRRIEEDSDSDSDSGRSKKRKVKDYSSEGLTSIKQECKQKFRYDPNDVSDGRTVFIKNVPFSAKDEDLLECAKKVGDVIYAVICVDRLTEHSRGTGFVKFKDKSVVDALINGKVTLVLNGHKLEPHLALKKNQIDSMKTKKLPKDNRNLFLVREGVILAGSAAAEGVSEEDMRKRLQLENWKTQSLKNLNKFVSPTRLVIHNLPPFVDDNKLRQLFKEHSPKGSVIREARVMRNLKDINEHGVGRSKGFGFVAFTKNEHALEALRAINNNPNIFKPTKRPIVGFSIENLSALKIKEKRKEASKALTEGRKGNKGSDDAKEVSPTKGSPSVGIVSENLPKFIGNVAKQGVKKMMSRRELNVQAKLHHKNVIEKKKAKKNSRFARKFNKFNKGSKKKKIS